MKISIQFFLSLALFVACREAGNKKGPILFYRSRIINLGTIKFKKPFDGKILVFNAGDESLKIMNTSSDCACTVTGIDSKKITPGDSTYIKFVISPAIDGYIQQNIYVDNNSRNDSRALFLVRAKVVL